MIDSLLEKLPQRTSRDESSTKGTPVPDEASAETSILAALPIVHRIVSRRRFQLDHDNRTDLVQEIALRIWRWRLKFRDKSEEMSGEDWNSFSARTAYNEVNRQLRRDGRSANLPFETAQIEQSSIEGQTDAEVFSLIHQVWQATCKLSLRQRRSLLLHSQELVIYFLQIGITERQIADALNFSETVWSQICDRVPMTDFEIAEISEGTAGSVKKARFEARTKLKELRQR